MPSTNVEKMLLGFNGNLLCGRKLLKLISVLCSCFDMKYHYWIELFENEYVLLMAFKIYASGKFIP